VSDPYAPLDQLSSAVKELAGLDLLMRREPLLRVQCVNEVMVVISRNRDPEQEVFLGRCLADQVPVVIRPSGGGAVVLSPGVVVVNLLSGTVPDRHLPDFYFRQILSRVIVALSVVGVSGITERGISDLCYNDRKIAGSSLRLQGQLVLFQLSLLVDPDLALISRYLRHPSREPGYRRQRTHDDFVVSLRQLGCTYTPAQVAQELQSALSRSPALA
jgi:lipoate---protein ligase